MFRGFISILAMIVSSQLYSQTQFTIERQLLDIDISVREGRLDYLKQRELSLISRNLKGIQRVLDSATGGLSEVICAPSLYGDFTILKKDTRAVIGERKFGNSWCRRSLDSARNGQVVIAPSNINNFAFFRISDGLKIGRSNFSFSWFDHNLVKADSDIVCAPSFNNNFSIYKISTGQSLGHGSFGSNWCKQVISYIRGDFVCAPSANNYFAVYRISDGKKVSNDRFGHEWCRNI